MSQVLEKLEKEYGRIDEHHWDAERHFFARVVLPSSVMRVFYPDTREHVLKVLSRTNVEALRSIRSQEKYRTYFKKQLDRVARVISKTNRGNSRLCPGHKWGHGTKILCLFLRDMVLHSRYLPERTAERVSRYL